MLTADVRFEGWTVTDWGRLLELLAPHTAQAPPSDGHDGGIIVVHDGRNVLKLLHTERGRIVPSFSWPTPLVELAATHGARFAIALHFGALDEVMERFGERVKREDTLTDQTLTLMRIFRELIVDGRIESWPEQLHGVPIPTPHLVARAVDAFCPVGKAFVFGAFERGDLWTGCVLHRTEGGFDRVVGPEELRRELGRMGGDVRRDYRYLAAAVESKYGAVSCGFYSEVSTLRALSQRARPGAWSRAIAVRDVILSPMPAGIGALVGIDVLRALLHKLFAEVHASSLGTAVEPLVGRVERELRGVTAADLLAALNFDPLAAFRALLTR